jgi:hypothetical protein
MLSQCQSGYAGLYFLFFKPEGKRYRLIGWMYLMNTSGLPLGSYNVAFLNTGTAASPNWVSPQIVVRSSRRVRLRCQSQAIQFCSQQDCC